MAFIRRYLLTAAVLLLAYVNSQAQTVYYPAGASQLLKSTAEDIALLLQKAVAGSNFITQPYSNIVPVTGVVLIYDTTMNGNQACKVKSNGYNFISFTAGQDNGLCYGVYEYLYQSGFKFYQPGAAWEIIPVLSSPYKNIDSVYACRFKYKTWFISGGVSTWAMDNNNTYYWDTYNGELGHQWALYQRRNNMVGAYRFSGHRDDVFTEDYLATLKSNPCYVAPFNGSRQATRQSVPDIHNIAAMQLWADKIESQYTQYKNHIYNHRDIYANYWRNFDYGYGNIGIEVPDGSRWANSENSECGTAEYPKESDQHFILANFTVNKISPLYPGKRFQLYAYDGHADIPSSSLQINANIDVQVVPTAFQFETSAKGLLNRWYRRWSRISEYHYLNMAQWSGGTPSFYLDDLKQTVQRLREKNGEGIIWEASASKFASLPYLLAANASLKNDKDIENQLQEFCNLFGEASATINKLLHSWSDDKTVMVYNGFQDNKYKLPYYFQLVKQAAVETQNATPLIKQRINELKAFLHYMVLFYDWTFDQRPAIDKAAKAEVLCLYLARINRLQIVNSSTLINYVVYQYKATDEIYLKYNTVNGAAYQNGTLPLITDTEIRGYFDVDYNAQTSLIQNYSFKDAGEITSQFERNGLLPLEKINIQLAYTNGKDYPAKNEFYMLAEKPGSFTVKYTPKFEMQSKGYINFTVESVSKTLSVITDMSLDNTSGTGTLHINLPEAGTYKLTITSRYKSSAAITINTNGNYFYKNGPFLGASNENYRTDILSLPGWFYIPAGIDKVFFSINNSNPGGGGFVTPDYISKAFMFKDADLNDIEPKLISNNDSALYYLQLPQAHTGIFYRVFKMEQARLCFSNISNIEWYARKKNCIANDFTAVIKPAIPECITQLKARSTNNDLTWQVYDSYQLTEYRNSLLIDLPATTSPNAIVILKSGAGCIITKRLADDVEYIKQKTTCAASATPVSTDTKVIIYPNPGTGVFKCMQNGEPVLADEVHVCNAAGLRMVNFTNAQQFNISNLPAGVYFYTLMINKVAYKGKLVKM